MRQRLQHAKGQPEEGKKRKQPGDNRVADMCFVGVNAIVADGNGLSAQLCLFYLRLERAVITPATS